jgi:hypothetical protein
MFFLFRTEAKGCVSVGGLGDNPLVGRSALCQQAFEFRFCFGAHAPGEVMGALPVLGPERGQANLQVRLVFCQAAQQTLPSGNFFFQ